MTPVSRSYPHTAERHAEAMEASSKAMAAFVERVRTISPEHMEKLRSVYGWLVFMYEQGWHDAMDKGN